MTLRTWIEVAGVLLGAAGLILGLQTGNLLYYGLTVAGWTAPLLQAVPRAAGGRPLLYAGALLLCLCCLPDLSDDVHRYLWEGHVQNQGYSPYSHAPDSLFDILDHPSESHINHPHLPAIYPPLAQYLFQLSDHLSQTVYGFKVLIALALLGLIAMSGPREVSLWAGPLVLIEGSWNAHLDVLGLLPAVWFGRALKREAGLQTGLALAAMTALKLIPAVLFPIALIHLKGAQRLRLILAFTAAMFLIYLPYLHQLPDLFTSFLTFSSTWSFNNPLFHGLKALFGNGAPARAALTLALLIGLLRVTLRNGEPMAKCRDAWLLIFITSPTLYPWYLIWLLPFLPEGRRRYLHAAYAATCLSYLVLIPYRAVGDWRESMAWMIPEWLIMLYCFAKARTSSAAP